MSETVITALLSLLSEYPYPLEAFIDGHAYAEAHYVNHAEAYLSSARSSSYVKATRTPVENMPDFIKKNITNIEGMDIVVSDPDVKQTIRKRAALIEDLYITSSAAHYIEFAAGNASKETALSYLLRMLSFDSSNLIAFGDSENDLEMLHFAKAGIAMGNAGELVKKQADYITASNTQHGVAEGILHFIPDIKMESLF